MIVSLTLKNKPRSLIPSAVQAFTRLSGFALINALLAAEQKASRPRQLEAIIEKLGTLINEQRHMPHYYRDKVLIAR